MPAAAAIATSIQTRALSVGIGGRRVLRDLDLELPVGGALAVMGQNGSGKSTLLRTLAGILSPLGGALDVLGGGCPARQPALRARIGYASQRGAWFPELTPREHLELVGASHDASGRVELVLERFDLAPVADRETRRLSGGYLQRLGLALAMVNEPDLLLLDEPASAVDPEHRARFFAALGERGTDCSLVFATHRIEEALDHADRVLVLHNGRALAPVSCRAAEDQVVLEFATPPPAPPQLTEQAPEALAPQRYRFELDESLSVAALVERAVAAGLPVCGVQSGRELTIAALARRISEGGP